MKKFGELQPIHQSFFTNIHDELLDHTICVAEHTRRITIYKVPYEIECLL